MCSSPRLLAAYHGLHRTVAPRHPPWTLSRLTIFSLAHRSCIAASHARCSAGTTLRHMPRASLTLRLSGANGQTHVSSRSTALSRALFLPSSCQRTAHVHGLPRCTVAAPLSLSAADSRHRACHGAALVGLVGGMELEPQTSCLSGVALTTELQAQVRIRRSRRVRSWRAHIQKREESLRESESPHSFSLSLAEPAALGAVRAHRSALYS